jgi:hypothetical protein
MNVVRVKINFLDLCIPVTVILTVTVNVIVTV